MTQDLDPIGKHTPISIFSFFVCNECIAVYAMMWCAEYIKIEKKLCVDAFSFPPYALLPI